MMIDDGVNLWRRILDWIGDIIWMTHGWYHLDDMWVISSRYHLYITHISPKYHPDIIHILHISSKYHPHIIHITSRYHPHIIQILSKFNTDITHISSRYQPHIIQISSIYHPEIIQISPSQYFLQPPTWWKVEFYPYKYCRWKLHF